MNRQELFWYKEFGIGVLFVLITSTLNILNIEPLIKTVISIPASVIAVWYYNKISISKYNNILSKELEIFKEDEVRKTLTATKYVDIISENRIKWIQELRDEIAHVSASIQLIETAIETNNNSSRVRLIPFRVVNLERLEIINNQNEKTELLKYINKIILRLNKSNSEAKELIEILESTKKNLFDSSIIDFEILKKNKEKLLELGGCILKVEWELVKEEIKEEIEGIKSKTKP